MYLKSPIPEAARVLMGPAETQRVSVIVDSYDADLRAGQIPPDQGWHQFAGEKGLLGDVLRAKGLI